MRCPNCDGRGEVLDAPARVLDGRAYWVRCDECDGTGEVGKVWHECQREYLPLGQGKVLDVSEGVNGEDRVTFRCGLCGQTHDNAMATRG